MTKILGKLIKEGAIPYRMDYCFAEIIPGFII